MIRARLHYRLALPGVGDTQGFLSNAPYVPTPQSTVDKMLELANVGPNDFVIDLGSGDGRILITAAKRFGARAVGIEIEADLIEKSRFDARWAGVGDRVTFKIEDLFTTDLRPATVLTLYLFRELNIQLRPRILEHALGLESRDARLGHGRVGARRVRDQPRAGQAGRARPQQQDLPLVHPSRWPGAGGSRRPSRPVARRRSRSRSSSSASRAGSSTRCAAQARRRARGTAVKFTVPGASPWFQYEGTATTAACAARSRATAPSPGGSPRAGYERRPVARRGRGVRAGARVRRRGSPLRPDPAAGRRRDAEARGRTAAIS